MYILEMLEDKIDEIFDIEFSIDDTRQAIQDQLRFFKEDMDRLGVGMERLREDWDILLRWLDGQFREITDGKEGWFVQDEDIERGI